MIYVSLPLLKYTQIWFQNLNSIQTLGVDWYIVCLADHLEQIRELENFVV